jgi:hypothetical protein
MRVDLVLKFDGNLCGVVKWILLFCCVCFPEIPVAGESRSSLIVITGEVKDADGEPLPGVTVVLKGTSLGCATGTDGYGAQNEAYMSRSAEKWVRGLCFNELGVCD